jgi:hypothetical protein
MSFGDGWISRFLARLSPITGLTACFCSCGRLFATPFFQPDLAALALGFATLVVNACDYLLSGNEYMPMSGTLGRVQPALNFLRARPLTILAARVAPALHFSVPLWSQQFAVTQSSSTPKSPEQNAAARHQLRRSILLLRYLIDRSQARLHVHRFYDE